MSTRYTADGRRKSSMVHANRSWTCSCGRTVFGNGGKSSHQRACLTYRLNDMGAQARFVARAENDRVLARFVQGARNRHAARVAELRSAVEHVVAVLCPAPTLDGID